MDCGKIKKVRLQQLLRSKVRGIDDRRWETWPFGTPGSCAIRLKRVHLVAGSSTKVARRIQSIFVLVVVIVGVIVVVIVLVVGKSWRRCSFSTLPGMPRTQIGLSVAGFEELIERERRPSLGVRSVPETIRRSHRELH